MNKEYTYVDGKAIITDENNNKIQSEYYDNLDKVLVQENLIETMEGKIQELEKESKSYKKYNRKHYIPIIFPITVLMSTVVAPLMHNLLTGSNSFAISVDTIFGPMSQCMAFSMQMAIGFIPLGVAMELFMYNDYKHSIKKEKGINCELDFLKKQVEHEKEVLKNLKKDKSRDKESTKFKTVSVNDLQQLKALKSWLDLYFDLGYNGEKYYQYYQQGKLDGKLQKYYNDTGIQVAKEYIENKGPSLSLKKRQKNPNNLKK